MMASEDRDRRTTWAELMEGSLVQLEETDAVHRSLTLHANVVAKSALLNWPSFEVKRSVCPHLFERLTVAFSGFPCRASNRLDPLSVKACRSPRKRKNAAKQPGVEIRCCY